MIQPLQVKPQEELKRFWKQHLDGWTGGIGGLLLDPVEKDEGTRFNMRVELRVKSQIWFNSSISRLS